MHYAECGCPVGMGPQGSCKHIASLAFALVDFCKLRTLPDYMTCTDLLQQWNKPLGNHIPPIPVEMLGSHQRELFPPKERAYGSSMVFDPCPFNRQSSDPNALENLRCNLLNISQPVGLLNIIVPSLDKIEHDHCYSLLQQTHTTIHEELNSVPQLPNCIVIDKKVITQEGITHKLKLT